VWEQQQAAKAAGGGLVGWWCRGYDAFEIWLMTTGDLLNAWSKGVQLSCLALNLFVYVAASSLMCG
jgi:hypothetical protein